MDPPHADLCLVSCVSRKLPLRSQEVAPARDLYVSSLFAKTRQLVEAQGWRWFILSAEHGLVGPEQEIAPYDKTLKKMRAAEKRAWANAVSKDLEPHLAGVRSIVVLAGKHYWEPLKPHLRRPGITAHLPMEGLVIGKRLAWLNEQLARPGRR